MCARSPCLGVVFAHLPTCLLASRKCTSSQQQEVFPIHSSPVMCAPRTIPCRYASDLILQRENPSLYCMYIHCTYIVHDDDAYVAAVSYTCLKCRAAEIAIICHSFGFGTSTYLYVCAYVHVHARILGISVCMLLSKGKVTPADA